MTGGSCCPLFYLVWGMSALQTDGSIPKARLTSSQEHGFIRRFDKLLGRKSSVVEDVRF